MVANYSTDGKKIKKFLTIAIPIFIIEVLAAIFLIMYFVLLPKNTLTISKNMDSAIVYINDAEKDKVRLKAPAEKQDSYNYDFEISVLLPGTQTYQVYFEVTCDKYYVNTRTYAVHSGNGFVSNVKGGEKTRLMLGIVLMADELIENFDVVVNITVTPIG